MARLSPRSARRALRGVVWRLQGIAPDEQRALRRIAASGLFDQAFYEWQSQQRFPSESAAIRHFLKTGEANGWSPTPLYDCGWYSTRARRLTRPFDHFLRTGQTQAPAGPHFDARIYLESHPEAAYARGGPLGDYLAHSTDETLTVPPADGALPMLLTTAKTALEGALLPGAVDAIDAIGALAAPTTAAGADGVTSLVVIGGQDWIRLHHLLAHGLRHADEVVWLDHETPLPVAAAVSARFLGEPRLQVLRPTPQSWSAAARLGIAHSTGDVLVFAPGNTEARNGWIDALVTTVRTSDADGAQPLLLDEHDLIHQMPGATLEGFPNQDGELLRGKAADRLVGCFAVRRTIVADGLTDGLVVNGGRFVVQPDAKVALFDELPDSDPGEPILVYEKGPQLRWAIKLPAHAGLRGDVWGDVAFAEDLAAALRELGQEVVLDRRLAHVRPASDHLDDVTLTIRGPIRYRPHGRATHVIWVISHPDEVTSEELGEFALAYAAGPAWAAQMGIGTLLQATDPARFSPDVEPMPGLDVLFVGRPRAGIFRPIVRDAVEAGANLSIFGEAWQRHIDPKYVVAEYLPNAELPSAYRGARIVLNDHWDDMRRLGFYSNRLFDATAVGARVISDPIDGVEDLFGSSVQVYRSVDELRDLLDPASSRWPDAEDLAANSARVREHDSFTARAKQLLDDVLAVRARK